MTLGRPHRYITVIEIYNIFKYSVISWNQLLITHMITDQIGLHSVQLPSLTIGLTFTFDRAEIHVQIHCTEHP